MNEKEKLELQKLIPSIERNVENLESLEQNNKNAKEQIQKIKQKLQYLKDIVWDRQSEAEREQMLKVLNGEKESTEVKSNVGNVLVDSDLTKKLKEKHLDNPNLRGMVTSDEFLSFPKVAKNVEPEFNPQYQGYTWRVKTEDEKDLIYGEREYTINGKDTHRLLTNYSESERGQRKIHKAGVGERGHSHRQINDPDFLRPAEEFIAQNKPNSANSLNEEQGINKNTKMGDVVLNENDNLVGGGDAHSPHPADKERVWATDTEVCSPTNNTIPQSTPKEPDKESQIQTLQEAAKKASQDLGLGGSTKSKGAESLKAQNIDKQKDRG